jgi:hypothetical protein
MIEFELSDELKSLKQIGEFPPLTSFKISGSGDLSLRSNSNKKGWGFEVQNQKLLKNLTHGLLNIPHSSLQKKKCSHYLFTHILITIIKNNLTEI